jgi:hypothetical protein
MTKDQLTNRQRNRFALTQREEMSNQISQLVRLSAYLFFPFSAVLIIDNVASLSLFEEFWRIFLVLALCALFVWGFSLLASRFIIRAILFHLLVSICTLFFISAPLFVLIWVVQNWLGLYGWILSAILTISVLIGYADEFKRSINWLQTSEKSLVRTGRLDKESGIWNVKVPMRMSIDDPKQSGKVKLAIIIVQVFVFMVSIYFGSAVYAPLFMGFLCSLMLYASFRQLGEPVAITVQLYFWERELGRTIVIKPDD